MTTKNGTFPITLTSTALEGDSTVEHTLVAETTARNFTSNVPVERDYWDRPDELLLTNDLNVTLDDHDPKKIWKRSINDAVSKNITSVLENLLKNYEKSQLPTHGKGIRQPRDDHKKCLSAA